MRADILRQSFLQVAEVKEPIHEAVASLVPDMYRALVGTEVPADLDEEIIMKFCAVFQIGVRTGMVYRDKTR